jgi:hypothetical protein
MKFLIRKSGLDDQSFKKLSLMILHAFFSGMFVSIFISVANAEFASYYDKEKLPLGYLFSGIIGYFIVQGYSRLLRKSGYIAFVGGILFLLVVTLLFTGMYMVVESDKEAMKQMSFAVFLFAMPFISISGLEQTGLLITTYGLRDTKAYAGIVNAGGTIASIIGYLLVPALIRHLSSPFYLFYVAIGAIIIALLLLFRINALFPLKQGIPVAASAKKRRVSLLSLMKQPYIRYLAICAGISMVAFYFVDYSFLINAKSLTKHLKGEKAASHLAAIIGAFFGCIKAAELILSLLSANIFRTFGLKVGIVLLPLACLMLSICAITSWHFMETAVFVGLIFALKFFERMLSKAIEAAAYKNLYQLLPADDRLVIQARIDGGIRQIFIIVSSVALMCYGTFVQEHAEIVLVYISVPLFALWIFSSGQLVRSFRQRLQDMLNPEDAEAQRQRPFALDLLKNAFTTVQNGSVAVQTALQSLISYKLRIPVSTPAQQTSAVHTHDTYVPSPEWNYLVSTPGYSRLGIRLQEPVFIIPPSEIKAEKVRTGFEDRQDDNALIRLVLSGKDPGEALLKEWVQKLDDVKTDHEKKLIINLIGSSDSEWAESVLLKYIDFPDYTIKRQVYAVLERKGYKCPPSKEQVYHSALETAFEDSTLVIALQSAIPATAEFADIREALWEEELVLKNRILSILTWKYDRVSINIIRETIFSGQQQNNVLALELIDNLLDRELKPKILPVFESDRYMWRLQALGKWYHVLTFSTEEALIKILNHDYTKFSTWIKACAIKRMIESEQTAYRKFVAGFIHHPSFFLRSLAAEYRERSGDGVLHPLQTEFDVFLKSSKTAQLAIKGSEAYDLLKALRKNCLFSRIPHNDLVRLVLSMEPKTGGNRDIAGMGDVQNKPWFIIDGELVMEFKGVIPTAVYHDNYITPGMFAEDRINKVLVHASTKMYEISGARLADLALASDALVYTLETSDN